MWLQGKYAKQIAKWRKKGELAEKSRYWQTIMQLFRHKRLRFRGDYDIMLPYAGFRYEILESAYNMLGLYNRRRLLLFLIDILCFFSAYTVAELVAFTFKVEFSLSHYLICAAVFLVMIFGIRLFSHVYENVWRYANSRTYLSMILADAAGGLSSVLILQLIGVNPSFWFTLCQAFCVAAAFDILSLSTRFIYQAFFGDLNRTVIDNNKIGVAIVGAGKTGYLLAQELMASRHSHYKPVCFVDKDKDKVGA